MGLIMDADFDLSTWVPKELVREREKRANGQSILDKMIAGDKEEDNVNKLLTDDELKLLPNMQWHIKKVLPSTGIGVIFGPSSSGKSFFVIDMALALSEGRDFVGYKVKAPVPVLYCAMEGGAGIKGRVHAHELKHGKSARNIRYLIRPFNLMDEHSVSELCTQIKMCRLENGVVFIDTLNRAAWGMDENSSKDMSSIIAALQALQMEIGGVVMAIHHTGKNESAGMRGHSSLHAALDIAIELKRNADVRTWQIAKAKDGDDSIGHQFNLETIIIGKDEDDEDVTSCVVNHINQSGFILNNGLNKRDFDVLELLKMALESDGIDDEKTDTRVIKMANFRRLVKHELGVSEGAVKNTLIRHVEKLVMHNKVLYLNGFLSIVHTDT